MSRQRRNAIEILRKRTLAAEWDLIVLESRPVPLRVCGKRVIEGDAPPLSINQATEITGPECSRGDGNATSRGLSKLVAFVRKEEERAVSSTIKFRDQHRSAD